jgi:acyl-CoA synthetase (AMP-forming)/AMP-acid ligase II
VTGRVAGASSISASASAPDVVELATLSAYLAHWASLTPSDTAVVSGAERVSWSALRERVDRCASGLARLGVGRGDVVAMLSPQRWEFVVLYLALDRLQAVFLGLNTRHQLPELELVLNDAKPSVLLTVGHFNGRDYLRDAQSLRGRCPSISTLVAIGPDSTDTDSIDTGSPEELTFEDLLKAGSSPPGLPRAVSATEPACIVYTSGSTGRPKGAVLPRRGLLSNHRALARRIAHQPFRAQCDHPIDHVGGSDRLYLVVILGGSLILAERFRPQALLDQIDAERITYWMGEATQFVRCREYLRGRDLPDLRVINFVGALPGDLLSELAEVSAMVTTGYGMTECCSAVIRSTGRTDLAALARGVIGPLLDTMAGRIVDASGRACEIGEVGELQIRSACLFTGYLGLPERTQERFTSDGWFATGDLFAEDEPGVYRFVARIGDVFSSGGYNIYPREIEAAATAHPAVEEAALIGVPDPAYGSVGWLYYTSVPGHQVTHEEVRDFVRQGMANYKVPARVVQLDAMPHLPNSKIDAKELRRRAHEAMADAS